MIIRSAQLRVTEDIDINLVKILKVLDKVNENDWVIFPEGMISGYYPEKSTFVTNLNIEKIREAIQKIHTISIDKNIRVIIGSAYLENNLWYNSTFLIGDSILRYDKVNLATLDRKFFQAGNSLKTYSLSGLNIGIQMCRDLVFPEQWKALKMQGANIIFHINNAIKPTDIVREHLVISRAFENQVYVCSVNNVGGQKSMLVAPDGNTIWSTDPSKEAVELIEIDLKEPLYNYLEQSRTDLVSLSIKFL